MLHQAEFTGPISLPPPGDDPPAGGATTGTPSIGRVDSSSYGSSDESGVPSVVADPDLAGVWWAGGYGGHGLAQAFRLGEIAARTIAHSAR